jgi:hypothetical protein
LLHAPSLEASEPVCGFGRIAGASEENLGGGGWNTEIENAVGRNQGVTRLPFIGMEEKRGRKEK